MNDIWVVVPAALGGGAAGSFVARSFARRFGVLNAPNPIVPQHTVATAYLGGVGVLTGLVAAWLVAPAPPIDLVVPAMMFCALGVIDDVRPFKALGKVVGQVLVASLAVALGLRLELTGLPAVDAVVTVLWLVTLVNAFNFTDVCDGLVAGLGAAFFLGWALLSPVQPLVGWAGFAACLGFLPFNLPKASMFLGDAGSHLVGFLVAALLTQLPPPSAAPLHVGQLVLAAGVPLFELVFITAVRLKKGLPWWKGSPDHFSLRLQQAGWSRWRVDLVAWTLMALSVAAGLSLPRLPASGGVAVVAIALAGSAFASHFLLRHEVVRA